MTEKIRYMKLMRDTLGDMFESRIKSKQGKVLSAYTVYDNSAPLPSKENAEHWVYHIIDVPDERCVGIMVKTRRMYKLIFLLERWGIMIIQETKLQKVGRVTKNNKDLHAYVLSLRLPEEQDIEKYLEKKE